MILAAYLFFTSLVHAVDYGVGFDLTLDYGVASIYFSNGTSADGAKIVGGPSYSQWMRTMLVVDEQVPVYTPDLNYSPWSGASSALLSLRDYLPFWLSNTDKPRIEPLSWMLKALKTATESYLETTISTVEIVLPVPISDESLQAIRSAASSLSLKLPLSAQPPSGILAARPYGVYSRCDPYPEPGEVYGPGQLILTVQYTRAALTALLVHEDCRIFEARRVLHSTSLGKDSLSHSVTSYSDLLYALRNVSALPLEDDDNSVKLRQISHLVVYGEAAHDGLLHDVLAEVRRDLNITSAITKADQADEVLFAASRSLAKDCCDRMNFALRDEL